jgi:hypothetical protein
MLRIHQFPLPIIIIRIYLYVILTTGIGNATSVLFLVSLTMHVDVLNTPTHNFFKCYLMVLSLSRLYSVRWWMNWKEFGSNHGLTEVLS